MITILIVFILLSLLWWVGQQFITDPMLLKIFRVIIVVFAVIWVLQVLGLVALPLNINGPVTIR